MRNAAVLTFLADQRSAADLTADDQKTLLTISYNNLVDWHLWVEPHSVTYVYNRVNPAHISRHDLTRSEHDAIRWDRFEQATGSVPNPNVPSLDDALIGTISLWKRSIAAEIGKPIDNQAYSTLFNGIILCRAIEDMLFQKIGAAPGYLKDAARALPPAKAISEAIQLNPNPPKEGVGLAS